MSNCKYVRQKDFHVPGVASHECKHTLASASISLGLDQKKKKRNSRTGSPGMNEMSFCARPHYNVYSILGVDIGATNPRWKVDPMGLGRIGKEERR
jgi:hypothetical protein